MRESPITPDVLLQNKPATQFAKYPSVVVELSSLHFQPVLFEGLWQSLKFWLCWQNDGVKTRISCAAHTIRVCSSIGLSCASTANATKRSIFCALHAHRVTILCELRTIPQFSSKQKKTKRQVKESFHILLWACSQFAACVTMAAMSFKCISPDFCNAYFTCFLWSSCVKSLQHLHAKQTREREAALETDLFQCDNAEIVKNKKKDSSGEFSVHYHVCACVFVVDSVLVVCSSSNSADFFTEAMLTKNMTSNGGSISCPFN